jgi:hypothetical protein
MMVRGVGPDAATPRGGIGRMATRTTIAITRDDLAWAAGETALPAEQAELLWQTLLRRPVQRPRLDLPHVAYYAGALIVIGAMTVFMGLAWKTFGDASVLVIALGYAVVFTLIGRRLWHQPDFRVPGGLLITVAVCMTPLAVYSFCHLTGLWPHGDPGAYQDYYLWVHGSWIALELGTMIAGVVALWFYRFPFLVMPIAFSLWFLSMDLTAILFGERDFSWTDRVHVSLVVGIVIVAVAWVVDCRTGRAEDFAFWLYFFGLLSLTAGLWSLWQWGEAGRALFALANVVLLLLAVLLGRPLFLVFGALGICSYLGYLSARFTNAWAYPFVLSALGLAIILLGIQYQRRRAGIEQTVARALPSGVRRILPDRR